MKAGDRLAGLGLAALVLVLSSMPAGAVTTKTPDELFADDVKKAISSELLAVKRLQAPVSSNERRQARRDVAQSIRQLKAAERRAAVGGPFRQIKNARGLDDDALAELGVKPDLKEARRFLRYALAQKAALLKQFGVPLTDEFEVRAGLAPEQPGLPPEFNENNSLVLELDAEDVATLVIGAVDRTTANAKETAASQSRRTSGTWKAGALPITSVGDYRVFTQLLASRTGKCTLENGIVTCLIEEPMGPGEFLNLSFGPRLARGTEVLLKFRSSTGKRAYEILTAP